MSESCPVLSCPFNPDFSVNTAMLSHDAQQYLIARGCSFSGAARDNLQTGGQEAPYPESKEGGPYWDEHTYRHYHHRTTEEASRAECQNPETIATVFQAHIQKYGLVE